MTASVKLAGTVKRSAHHEAQVRRLRAIQEREKRAYFAGLACEVMIYGNGTPDSVQVAINLARVATGADPLPERVTADEAIALCIRDERSAPVKP